MKIGELKLTKKQIITALMMGVLFLGLIATMYLVKNPQVLKIRATTDLSEKVEISSDQGKVEYQGGNTWKTNSDSIEIGIKGF